MEYEVLYGPTYSLLAIKLRRGESVDAEAGAMVAMSPEVRMKTGAKGGILQGLKRILGGETFFINTFTAEGGDGEVLFAPPYQGDIRHIALEGRPWLVQGSSYIASAPSIELDVEFMGFKGLLAREGLFFLKAKGYGDLFISSFGAIHEVELKPGWPYVVDTGHLVALEDGVDFSVRAVGGLRSLFLSGEGLVSELRGSGKVLIQTRSVHSFISWLAPFLPRREGSGKF